ncbi:MAG: acetyl-CoA C-acyltransferase FadI [Myxococcota bacterium]
MAIEDNGTRVAIVAGLRTPFAKQGTAYGHLSALDLGKQCTAELLQRTGLEPSEVQQVVYGQVVPSVHAPNIAREIVLGTGMPRDVEAYSVSRACATSYQSTVNLAQAIRAGDVDCGIAGGADSASDVPITVSKNLQESLMEANKARSMGERVQAFSGLGLKDLLPVPPALEEPSTGLSMGESAEKMAKENHISREAQDELAHRSHTRAARAWDEGKLSDEVMTVHVPPEYEVSIREDNLVRKDSQLESYAKLKPVFDRRHGTITAANSSPLTDGAASLLLMREDKAKSLGYEPLGYLTAHTFVAVDPADQMLIGPAYAAPKVLDRAGLSWDDMDLIDFHEAFGAQILSVTQRLESDAFAREALGRDRRVADIDWEAFNVNGGSIAIGHPFAATGARQITQTLRELGRRGGEYALLTACAAGGLAAGMVLEAG